MNAFYNLKLANKLLLSFILVLLLTVGQGVFSVIQLSQVNQKSTDLAENWMPSARVLLELKTDLARYRTNELQHILSDSAEDRSNYEKAMNTVWEQVEKNLAAYQKLPAEGEEKELGQKLTVAIAAYKPMHDKIMAASNAQRDADARALARGEALQVYRPITSLSSVLVIGR